MRTPRSLAALALALAAAFPAASVPPAAAAPAAADSAAVRATFDRFVAAQNAHDAAALGALLLDSPAFLWVTRGQAVWGREAALARFRALYAGTWALAPDTAGFRVVFTRPGVAELFVPVDFTIGSAGQPAVTNRFLMNQVLVDAGGWKVASLLPIPVPPPSR